VGGKSNARPSGKRRAARYFPSKRLQREASRKRGEPAFQCTQKKRGRKKGGSNMTLEPLNCSFLMKEKTKDSVVVAEGEKKGRRRSL